MSKKTISKSIDVDEFLNEIATTKKSKGKSDMPEITGKEDLVDELIDLYQTWKDAEASFRSQESDLLQAAKEVYEERFKMQKFAKSFAFLGKVHSAMKVTFKDKFSDLQKNTEPRLRELLGEKFDSFFEKKREIKLLDTSDETVSLLVEKLGPEKFKDIFQIEVKIKVKPDMDRRQFELPQEIRAMLTQDKAACSPKAEKE